MTKIMTGLTSHHIDINGEGRSVRTVLNENGDPLFVAKDVCDLLGYTNSRKAVADHVPQNHQNTVTIRDGITAGNPNQTVITEAGLYRLIFASKMPAAEEFTAWVTECVLPQIRETGVFIPGETAEERAEALKQLMQAERAIARAEKKKAAVLRGEAPTRKAVAQKKDVRPRPEGWLTIPEFVRIKLPPESHHHSRAGQSLGWKCRDAQEGFDFYWVEDYSQPRRAYPQDFLEGRWPRVVAALQLETEV